MTEELKQLREALRRVKHEAASLADAQVIALEALTQRPAAQAGEREAFDPVAEGGRIVAASARKSADDDAWKKLFWEVARLLKCLPSSFVDGNEHVLKKARELQDLPPQPAAQATPDVPETDFGNKAPPELVTLGPLAKRNIYDAIRAAYDLGYNDARNARTVPGDSAPGYDGRSVEEDHGSALFNLLSKRLKPATPEPVGEAWGWAIVDKHDTAQAIRPRRQEFFGVVQESGPFTAEEVAKMDREWAGLVPHRMFTLYTRPAPGVPESEAARDVMAERQRQITAEGWTPEHDDEHDTGELAKAAASYAWGSAYPNILGSGNPPDSWPWSDEWWKPAGHRRNLIKAGALILAEIERIDRAAAAQAKGVQS